MTSSRLRRVACSLAFLGLVPTACGGSDPAVDTDGSTSAMTTEGLEPSDGTVDSTGSGTSGSTGSSSGTIDSTESGSGSGTSGSSDSTDGGEDTTGLVPPSAPVLELSFSQVKQFDFGWAAVPGAEHYDLLERTAPAEPLQLLAGAIIGESISLTMPLHFRREASYVLRACNEAGCTDSAELPVMESLAAAVGYVKASNTGAFDWFGANLALSANGNTLVVGARLESSNASGIDGDQANKCAEVDQRPC